MDLGSWPGSGDASVLRQSQKRVETLRLCLQKSREEPCYLHVYYHLCLAFVLRIFLSNGQYELLSITSRQSFSFIVKDIYI